MLHVSKVSRDRAAIPAYKSNWLVYEQQKMIRENLGAGKPAFFYGEIYPTLQAAKDAGYQNFGVRRLEEEIKLPTKSPIVNRTSNHQADNCPLTRVTILTFDMGGQGLSLNDYSISDVDFSIPPPSLIDLVDFVPHRIYVRTPQLMRISIAYDRDNNLFITDNPWVLNDQDFEKSSKHMAFFHHEDAIREIERIENVLLKAADWRSRDKRFVLVCDDEAA